MQQRVLQFSDQTEIVAELQRLRRGYVARGNWDLSQTCDHLAYFVEGSLDGHQFKVPWLFKVLFGRFVLRRILKSGKMKAGVPTPQKPLPVAGADEPAAVARLTKALERLFAHNGELHASPFFGYLTPQEWRRLHVIHCAHHLGFLEPK